MKGSTNEKKINYQVMNLSHVIKFIIIIYLIYGLIIITLGQLPDQWYIVLLYFIMLKMIFNYDKCTISYIECKLRGVKKKEGYLYRFVNSFIELRNEPFLFIILIFYTIIFSIYYFNAGGKLVF